MIDLSRVTSETFEVCLNQPFTVRPEGMDTLDIVLVETKKRGVYDPDKDPRQAFSVLFRGPPSPPLPQRVYAMENATLGELTLFLVPIGPEGGDMLYEATFA